MFDPHSILDAVASVGIVGIAGLIWKASSRFAQVATRLEGLADDVHEIKDNHLPHLQEEITDLRDKFFDHINKGS